MTGEELKALKSVRRTQFLKHKAWVVLRTFLFPIMVTAWLYMMLKTITYTKVANATKESKRKHNDLKSSVKVGKAKLKNDIKEEQKLKEQGEQ